MTKLTVPPEVLAAVKAVRFLLDPTNWMLMSHSGKGVLKLVGKGTGGIQELMKHVVEDDVQYGLVCTKDYQRFGYVEYVGSACGGMKAQALVQEHKEMEELVGYCHHTIHANGKDELVTKSGHDYDGSGETVEGRSQFSEETLATFQDKQWEAVWAATGDLSAWDPKQHWIYKWNEVGHLKFSALSPKERYLLRLLKKKRDRLPKYIFSKEQFDLIEKVSNTEKDLDKLSEEQVVFLARVDKIPEPGEEAVHPPAKHATPKKEEKKEEAKKEEKKEEVMASPPPGNKLLVARDTKKYFIFMTSLGVNPVVNSTINSIIHILTAKKKEFQKVDLYLTPEYKEEMYEKTGGVRLLPQIFINDVWLKGGADDFMMMNERGEI